MYVQQYESRSVCSLNGDNIVYYPFNPDFSAYDPYSVWLQQSSLHHDILMDSVDVIDQQWWRLQEDATMTVDPQHVYYAPTMGAQYDFSLNTPTEDSYPINSTSTTTETSTTNDNEGLLKTPPIKICINCETTATSTWRRFNGRHMCNSCKIYNGHRRFVVTTEEHKLTKRLIRHSRRIVACSICKNNDATFNYVVGTDNDKNWVYECRDCYNGRAQQHQYL